MRSITLAAAMAAVVAVPTAAHAGPEDTWRHVYFTPASLGDFEAAGSHEVWHMTHKKYAPWPSVSRWTGGSTWQSYSLPGLTSLLPSGPFDIDVVSPNEVWVGGTYMASISPGFYARYLARWDGTKWTQISAPAPPSTSSPGIVLAAGSGGVWYADVNHISRWDGSSWTTVAMLDKAVKEIHSFTEDNALATTDDGLWKWDGASWQRLPGEWPATAQITGPDSAWYADTGGLRTWNGTSWNTIPYSEGWQDPETATPISESDGLWVYLKRQNGNEVLCRWKDGAWTSYADTPSHVKQVAVDDAGRVWAVDRITRYMPSGSGQAPEHKGKLLRLNADGLGWEPVSSVPEAYYRMIELPGSDRLYAYGHNWWTGTDHITTNAAPLP